MPNLRQIVDGKVIVAASPMAKHVSNHMQDPVGATKDQFGKLQKAKLNYDMAREETQRNLSPVQSVITHLSQLHNLQPNSGVAPLQDPNDPNNPMQTDDPNAMQDPNAPDPNNPQYNQDGVAQNQSQVVGKMNQSRPSLAGHQPGVAPGDGQTVRPPKMGIPKPGQGNAGARAGAPGAQYGKTAKPPKGNRSLPGAKGPGDPKVVNKAKKAQNNSSRQIKVHVTASSTTSQVLAGASKSIATQFGRAKLVSMSAAGTALGAKKNWSTRGKGHLSKKEKKAHHDTIDARDFSQSRRKKLAKSGVAEKDGSFPIVNKQDLSNVSGRKLKFGGPGSGRHKELVKAVKQFARKNPGQCEKGMCSSSSYLLAKFLKSKGFTNSKQIGGLFDPNRSGNLRGPHNWVKVGDTIIDLTAHQFYSSPDKKKANKIIITDSKDSRFVSGRKLKFGRAKNRSTTIRHINERAKALRAPGVGGKKVNAGPSSLSDKVNDSGDELSYNPVHATSGKCSCGKVH